MTHVMFLIAFSMPRNCGGLMERVWRDWGEMNHFGKRFISPAFRIGCFDYTPQRHTINKCEGGRLLTSDQVGRGDLSPYTGRHHLRDVTAVTDGPAVVYQSRKCTLV
jgi:hypothetical protein